MTHNPYAPPAAPVADVPPVDATSAIDRHVRLACTLFWWAFWAAIAAQATRAPLELGSRSALMVAISAVVGCVLKYFLTLWGVSKLRAGRNWMRLLITIVQLAAVSAIALFWSFYKPLLLLVFGGNPAYAALTG